MTSLLVLCLTAALGVELDPEQPYLAERSNPVTYEVDYRVIVTPPAKTKRLQVWMPLPSSDFGQEVRGRKLETFPLAVSPQIGAEPTFGNTFAYFQFDQPPGAREIRHRFQIQVWELRWRLDPAKIMAVSSWPVAFDRYRRGETQAVVVNDQVSRLLDTIVPQRGHPLADMATVLGWVNDNFQYDHAHASLAASSLHGLTHRRGHCSDYHGFCASMGRAMGLPTRITYGLHAFEKASPSHCKLEVYLPPYGWVSFDVSETQRQMAEIRGTQSLNPSERERLSAAVQQRLLSGFRDNTWFVQTRGSDYDLAPPASRRVSVVRTIYAEADGVPLADPDPSDPNQRQFAWMTVARFQPDRSVQYPFHGVTHLE